MIIAYSKTVTSSSSTALAAIRLTFNSLQKSIPLHPTPWSISTSSYSTSSSTSSEPSGTPTASSSDPLNPNVPLSPFGLPLTPLPLPLPSVQSAPISREALERLHRLSALDPPAEGSAEEAELIDGLKGLIGLMEAVKAVELPSGGHGALLGRGVGELELDFTGKAVDVPVYDTKKEAEVGMKKGRELLEYATRRVGDYYASRLPQKTE